MFLYGITVQKHIETMNQTVNSNYFIVTYGLFLYMLYVYQKIHTYMQYIMNPLFT